MAATIATCTGIDKNREKTEHRLGHIAARAQAATWRTFATVLVNKDGSGYVEIRRDGDIIHAHTFGQEASS